MFRNSPAGRTRVASRTSSLPLSSACRKSFDGREKYVRTADLPMNTFVSSEGGTIIESYEGSSQSFVEFS